MRKHFFQLLILKFSAEWIQRSFKAPNSSWIFNGYQAAKMINIYKKENCEDY